MPNWGPIPEPGQRLTTRGLIAHGKAANEIAGTIIGPIAASVPLSVAAVALFALLAEAQRH